VICLSPCRPNRQVLEIKLYLVLNVDGMSWRVVLITCARSDQGLEDSSCGAIVRATPIVWSRNLSYRSLQANSPAIIARKED
jgi:hypothetical protein